MNGELYPSGADGVLLGLDLDVADPILHAVLDCKVEVAVIHSVSHALGGLREHLPQAAGQVPDATGHVPDSACLDVGDHLGLTVKLFLRLLHEKKGNDISE